MEMSERLSGMLGECFAKDSFTRQNWAYASTEQIFKAKNYQKIEFKLGTARIMITIPEDIQLEIMQICKPHNSIYKPYYDFDFLICKLNSKQDRFYENADVNDFLWVEVKTGNSVASRAQLKAKSKTSIPVELCRVRGISRIPDDIHLEYSKLKKIINKENDFSEFEDMKWDDF